MLLKIGSLKMYDSDGTCGLRVWLAQSGPPRRPPHGSGHGRGRGRGPQLLAQGEERWGGQQGAAECRWGSR